MTDREKAIVMAHTGICMLAGDKFQIFHRYVEDILGKPVQTIEMGMESVADEIKEKSRDDFITLCREEQEPCEDAISREDALMCLTGEIKETDTIETIIARFVRRIRKLPSVTPQPKIGHWRHYEGMLICSKCGSEFYDDIMEYCGDDVPKCCPDCGAKMIEPQESEE